MEWRKDWNDLLRIDYVVGEINVCNRVALLTTSNINYSIFYKILISIYSGFYFLDQIWKMDFSKMF